MKNGIDAALLTFWSPALRLIVQERVSNFFIRHCPPCVYPLSTWHHHTWSDLPGHPLHSVYHKWSKLEVGTAWERGYGNHASTRADEGVTCTELNGQVHKSSHLGVCIFSLGLKLLYTPRLEVGIGFFPLAIPSTTYFISLRQLWWLKQVLPLIEDQPALVKRNQHGGNKQPRSSSVLSREYFPKWQQLRRC